MILEGAIAGRGRGGAYLARFRCVYGNNPVIPERMMRLRARVLLITVAALAGYGPGALSPVQAAQDLLEAPACGGRIFVTMGVNQNYPTRESMRVPRGDLYLNDTLVGTISKNPEMVILDVPAGTSEVSWIPTSYDEPTRDKTRRNPLRVTLGEKETAFVALDWYNDSPNAVTIGYRTEVAARDRAVFAGKRVAYARSAPMPCGVQQAAVQPSAQASPAAPAPKAPAAKAAPASDDPLPDASDAFMASLQYYYVVNARNGAPVYATQGGDVTPLYTFPDKAELKVVDVSADKRWLTVTIPGGNRTGFVSAALVTSGVRAPR